VAEKASGITDILAQKFEAKELRGDRESCLLSRFGGRIKHSSSCTALTLALTSWRRFWTTTSPSLTHLITHAG
jgi:hypothetical protein